MILLDSQMSQTLSLGHNRILCCSVIFFFLPVLVLYVQAHHREKLSSFNILSFILFFAAIHYAAFNVFLDIKICEIWFENFWSTKHKFDRKLLSWTSDDYFFRRLIFYCGCVIMNFRCICQVSDMMESWLLVYEYISLVLGANSWPDLWDINLWLLYSLVSVEIDFIASDASTLYIIQKERDYSLWWSIDAVLGFQS